MPRMILMTLAAALVVARSANASEDAMAAMTEVLMEIAPNPAQIACVLVEGGASLVCGQLIMAPETVADLEDYLCSPPTRVNPEACSRTYVPPDFRWFLNVVDDWVGLE